MCFTSPKVESIRCVPFSVYSCLTKQLSYLLLVSIHERTPYSSRTYVQFTAYCEISIQFMYAASQHRPHKQTMNAVKISA